MSFSVLTRSPQFPDSPVRLAELVLMLAAIITLAWLVSSRWVAMSMGFVALAGFLFDFAFYIPAAILFALLATYIGRRIRAEPIRQARFGAAPKDIAILTMGFLLYELGRSATEGDLETATANASWLMDLQIWLRLPDEARFQGWAFEFDWLMRGFNIYYSYFFLATTIGTLIWLSFNAPAVYKITRTALGISTFSALAFFATVPLAPPRLVESSEIVSSHARVGLSHGYMNEFAAMPSLHVGWMALMGWALARAIGGWPGRIVGVSLPSIMMITVVVTGHHFWMDGVVGAVLCVTPAILLVRFPIFGALPARDLDQVSGRGYAEATNASTKHVSTRTPQPPE